MSTVIVYNPSSGFFLDRLDGIPAQDYFRRVLAELDAAEVSLRVFDGDRLDELQSDWRHSPPDAVWVAGGDGTILAIAGITRQLGIPLGILPGGTMNLLARDLGMDLDMGIAIRQLRDARPANIDVAEVNGRSFLCISNVGMPTRLTERREHLRRHPPGLRWALLAWHVVRLLFVYPRMTITLEVDGRQRRLRTRAASVSNNPLAPNGGLIPARDRLDRGELGLYVARDRSFWSLPRMALNLLTGDWQDDDDLLTFSSDRISIDIRGKKHIRIMSDGEMRRTPTPLEFSIRPAALPVLKPRAAAR